MIRIIRVLVIFFRISLIKQIGFRTDFIFAISGSLISTLVSIATILFMFEKANTLGGWGFYQIIALMGFFRIIKGFVSTFIQENFTSLQTFIRNGYFDFLLLKPLNTQFHASFRKVEFLSSIDIFLGIIMVAYGAISDHIALTALGIVSGIALTFAAIVLIYSVWAIAMAITFWMVNTNSLGTIIHTATDFGQFPSTVYPEVLQFIFTFLFPIALSTSFPVSAFWGNESRYSVVLVLFMSVALFAISKYLWSRALISYSSVNG